MRLAVPAVLLGNFTAEKLPIRAIHVVAAILFALLGIAVVVLSGDAAATASSIAADAGIPVVAAPLEGETSTNT